MGGDIPEFSEVQIDHVVTEMLEPHPDDQHFIQVRGEAILDFKARLEQYFLDSTSGLSEDDSYEIDRRVQEAARAIEVEWQVREEENL